MEENTLTSSDCLQIGNYDSLILFGSDAQQSLREFSKSLSVLLTNSNGDLEYLIHDLLNEIEDFQQTVTEKRPFSFLQSESAKRDHLIKKYDAVLVCIDKMDLALKLQEAQLIKDSKMLEKLGKLIEESSKKLEEAILYGNSIMNQKSECFDDELSNWYVRLSKRLQDLEITHTVSVQSQAQLKLISVNNAQLIDKIIAAVTGTIPIWRNQVTLLLGIERMNRNLEVQNKVSQITQSYLETGKGGFTKKTLQDKKIDTDKLLTANIKLMKSLDDLASVENKDSSIRLELNNSLM